MKRVAVLAAVMVALAAAGGAFYLLQFFQPSSPSEGSINWRHDFHEALNLAQVEGKLLMMEFYADWCGWCRKLDMETYTDPRLAAFLNEEFIPLKIDVENRENLVLADRYRVWELPTIVFLTPAGEEVGRIVGYRPPDAFRREALAILEQWER
ncbi:thioredoxin family protein [Candidatus Hecatella orcuttiae]|jgi:uncharacterized protein YyaL (SSP411 family)|uniref:thioredoxin family protein n=1 Tax=Candidatus Hecatella orcuttiae TaxID=1935119 RepID=UPI002867CC83|nr:DUF255 domain-containing protein [Candidatus Hecatella orcuttiae]